MIQTVFNKIESSSENVEFTLKVSMLEIYLENVKDLLNPTKDKLIIKQDPKKGIFIPDLTERYITCPQDAFNIMNEGNHNRATSSTQMNDTSSRSHSMFVLIVTQKDIDGTVKIGKLYLVDLAGSEKVGKTGVSG